MKTVSMTEFRKNFDYYIETCDTENITLTKYGKPKAMLMGHDQYQKTIREIGEIKIGLTDLKLNAELGENGSDEDWDGECLAAASTIFRLDKNFRKTDKRDNRK